MPNIITNFLDFKDNDIEVKQIPAPPGKVYFEISKKLESKFCPFCNFRMHSRGSYTRTVKHPILQDGNQIYLILKPRRWRCSNPDCTHQITDEFSFVEKYRHITKYADFLIVEAFRDFSKTASQIAKQFNVSDTYAIQTFARYVDMPRLKLTQAISIDEVCLNILSKYKYALIIQDFYSGEPIDMVVSRKENVTLPYFANIPRIERAFVKYLITDMYKPYLNYVNKYFPNAIPVIDSFHVIQYINGRILSYIRCLQKNFRSRDIRENEEKERRLGRKLALRQSKEVYLLLNFRWLILKNLSTINYSSRPFFDKKFNCQMYTSDYESELFKLDPSLKELRDLKEMYIHFNFTYAGDPDGARREIDFLIETYWNSKYEIFQDFAAKLQEYKTPIINSFIMLKRMDRDGLIYSSRLSNGPMESLNRVPKDMKRSARGYRNFEHIRNRFLFAKRKDAPIKAVPRPIAELPRCRGKVRGRYKKHVLKFASENEE